MPDNKPQELDLFVWANENSPQESSAVDKTNLIAGTVIKAAQTAVRRIEGKTSPKSSKRIEDFGEKIGGARKDAYMAYRDLIGSAVAEEIASVPLSKSWPQPNYAKLLDSGVESWTVDAIRALRDAVERQPGKRSYKLGAWAEEVAILRDMAVSVLDDEYTEEKLASQLEDFGVGRNDFAGLHPGIRKFDIARKAKNLKLMYGKLGHEQSFADLTIEKVQEHFNPNTEDNRTYYEIWQHTGKYRYCVVGKGDTIDGALENFSQNENYRKPTAKQPKKKDFRVYRRLYKDNEFFIGFKVAGGGILDVQSPFATPREAFDFIEDHYQFLEERLEKCRKIPFEREDENQPRTGDNKRTADVTPEQFAETFGFRGVEFGNWVENKTRQENLNNAYDALMDLSTALNLPPRALSLNGTLGLAFGARGRGGANPALAHYEPAKVVINLTKNKGAGSLGHEWFHALDNYFSRQGEYGKTNMVTATPARKDKLRDEVADAVEKIYKTIRKTGLPDRCRRLDDRKNGQYWASGEEMAARCFEAYLRDKLKECNITNDYLVNFRTDDSWDKAAKEYRNMTDTYPYPTAEELPSIKDAYDNLFASIKYREHDSEFELYSASNPDIAKMREQSELVLPQNLALEQKALQAMSREVFDTEMQFFDGAPELHGRYDEDTATIYVNRNAETSMNWAFWHEAFHAMKDSEPDLYADLIRYTEQNSLFTPQELADYRKSIKQPNMSDLAAMEEMMADAFADLNTGRRICEDMTKRDKRLAARLAEFTQKLVKCVNKLFRPSNQQEKAELQQKYPGVALNNTQFRDFSQGIQKTLASLPQQSTDLSRGYRILSTVGHSPYQYNPAKQRAFDIEAGKKLLQQFSSTTVRSVIGQKYGERYAEGIMREANISLAR